MKRITKFISLILTLSLLCASLCFPASAIPGTQEKCPAVADGELLKYWLVWNGISAEAAEHVIRPDGSRSSWDFYSPDRRGINLINTYFAPIGEDGKSVEAVPSTPELKQHCDLMQYELGKAHEAGMKVFAYSDDVQFTALEAEKMGIPLEDLTALKGGEPMVDTQWFRNPCYLACLNSPAWRGWLKANMRVLAEAGFDGIQYDYAPYLAEGYFCDCKYCRESWSAYKADTLGADKPLASGNLYFEDELDREYFRWRMQCLTDFFRETIAGAKEVNPDFIYTQNNNVLCYSFPFEALLNDSLDMTSSEYGLINDGYVSTMFMYQLNESLGFHELLGMFNNTGMCSPLWRYKVSIAEAFAVNGGLSLFNLEEADRFLAFETAHPGLFLDTKSSARTAILYSAESSVFSLECLLGEQSSGMLNGDDDVTRSLSTVLSKGQIVHDYLCVEKDDALERLDRYDTFVIPEYTFFEEGTWDSVLEKLMQSDKTLIVVGKDAGSFVEGYADGAKATVKYYTKRLGSGLLKELDGTGADRVKMLTDAANTEASIRTTDEYNEIVHIIRYGSEDNLASENQSFALTVPEGKMVKSVTLYAPFGGDDALDAVFAEEDHVLTVTADGKIDTWEIAYVEYEDAPEPVEPPIIFGDADGDGKVGAKDAAALAKYLAGWQITVDGEASDVNRDGTVNAKDLALIMKYLAGWQVTLGA